MKKISIKIDYDQSVVLANFIKHIITAYQTLPIKANSTACALAVITVLFIKISKENIFRFQRKKLKLTTAEAYSILFFHEYEPETFSSDAYKYVTLQNIIAQIDQQTKSLR